MTTSKKKTRNLLIGIAVVVAVAGLSAFIGVNAYNHAPAQRLSRQLDLGQRYLSELNYEAAVAVFTEAIVIEPKAPDAYIGLADAYDGLGEWEKAMEVLEDGWKETEDKDISEILVAYYIEKSEKYAEQGNDENAREILMRGVRLPDNEELKEQILFYEEKGRRIAEEASLEKASDTEAESEIAAAVSESETETDEAEPEKDQTIAKESDKELSVYFGSDLKEIYEKFLSQQEPSRISFDGDWIVIDNGAVTLETFTNGKNVVENISIHDASDYTIYGIKYGMKLKDARRILESQGWEGGEEYIEYTIEYYKDERIFSFSRYGAGVNSEEDGIMEFSLSISEPFDVGEP